jgi:hypothetical protein
MGRGFLVSRRDSIEGMNRFSWRQANVAIVITGLTAAEAGGRVPAASQDPFLLKTVQPAALPEADQELLNPELVL